jgi:hypothetical protein
MRTGARVTCFARRWASMMGNSTDWNSRIRITCEKASPKGKAKGHRQFDARPKRTTRVKRVH